MHCGHQLELIRHQVSECITDARHQLLTSNTVTSFGADSTDAGMKFILLVFACLIAGAFAHPRTQYGEIDFKGCYQSTCQKDDYHGFGCHYGKCDYVCKHDTCHHKGHPVTYEFIGKAHLKGEVIFEGCHEPTCHHREYEGFGCHEQQCRYVCDHDHCGYAPKQISEFTGNAKFVGEVTFHECIESTCKRGDYYGYRCNQGHCECVCNNDDCNCNKNIKGFSGVAKFDGEVYFEGCYKPTCYHNDYHGFGCNHGKCPYVCKHDTCHYKGHPVTYEFIGKAHLKGEVIFEGCYEPTCYYREYKGFDCHGQHCKYVCDHDHCGYAPKRVSQYTGQAKFVGEVTFQGCIEPTCKRGEYRGYDCHKGHCECICKNGHCDCNKKLRYAVGVTTFVTEIKFNGCSESTCQRGDHYGFGCRRGRCEYICKHDICNFQNAPVTHEAVGKATFVGELDFGGCNANYCRSGEYSGFGCNGDHCNYVCKPSGCFYVSADEWTREAEFVAAEEEFDYGKELQKIQFSKFFNFGDKAFF